MFSRIVKKGQFVLSTGVKSDYTYEYGDLSDTMSEAYCQVLHHKLNLWQARHGDFDVVVGSETQGIRIGYQLSKLMELPFHIMPKKRIDLAQLQIPAYPKETHWLIVDDIVTTGSTFIRAVDYLEIEIAVSGLTDRTVQSFAGQRRKMIEDQLVKRGIKDLRIMEAMNRIPRHLFVDESLQHKSYGDFPLPIGDNQTISQPYIVAAMTEALKLKKTDRVLEIGTGSGYQTALLAEMACQVFTIERIRSLGMKAQKLLDRLNYMNIVFKVFDGTYGWLDQAPFDAILVTASAPEIPKMLVDQLGDSGRLVAPVGDLENQSLTVMTRENDRITSREIGYCKFVPLVGKYGWPGDKGPS